MTGPEQLFEIYKQQGLNYLQSLVGREVETQIQDFKLLDRQRPPMTKNDKRIYSKALSGFANSDGGVIVWGVDCRKDASGADVVQPLSPMTQLSLLLSDLNSLCSLLVSPGVAALSIPIYNRDADGNDKIDEGYAVTLVPKGESEPVQATCSDHEFRYRAGSSFLPMPQWMVSDRFGRRPHPKLELSLSHRPADKILPTNEISVVLTNTGLTTVRDFGLVIDYSKSSKFTVEPMYIASFNTHSINSRMVLTGHNQLLFPTISKIVTQVMAPSLEPFVLSFELYCDGFSTKGEIELDSSAVDSTT